jgi:hypothetical protein
MCEFGEGCTAGDSPLMKVRMSREREKGLCSVFVTITTKETSGLNPCVNKRLRKLRSADSAELSS